MFLSLPSGLRSCFGLSYSVPSFLGLTNIIVSFRQREYPEKEK